MIMGRVKQDHRISDAWLLSHSLLDRDYAITAPPYDIGRYEDDNRSRFWLKTEDAGEQGSDHTVEDAASKAETCERHRKRWGDVDLRGAELKQSPPRRR